MARVIEIYAGAYASGKSETALNRARQYAQLNKPITLVDLDTVEPAYTLRPIANDLRKMGINVITQPDNFGLGEAASYVTPAQVNFLSNDGDIIVDVGYGAGGLDILDIVNNIFRLPINDTDIWGKIGGSLQFFIYDSIKIIALLSVLIFIFSYLSYGI